jgi:hypothetical protein
VRAASIVVVGLNHRTASVGPVRTSLQAGNAVRNLAGKDRRFQQRIAGKTVGTVEARDGDLAAGPESFDRASPGEVNRDPAHVVVRGRTSFADWWYQRRGHRCRRSQ